MKHYRKEVAQKECKYCSDVTITDCAAVRAFRFAVPIRLSLIAFIKPEFWSAGQLRVGQNLKWGMD
ncbi:MAG: hypothetical protein ACLSB7_17600 [Parabacteroides distasonis]